MLALTDDLMQASLWNQPMKNPQNAFPRAPTLDDVARASGLSSMTVSRALNTPERVRPETVSKVLAAVQATGYIPNASAAGLATRKSRLIAVVVPQINNNMFVDIIQSLNDELALRGYHMLLCVSGYEASTEAEIVATLLSRRPDGIVLTGIHHSPTLKKVVLHAAIPVVEMWDMTPTPLDMLVGFSHEKVGEKLGRFLVEKGYSRPALLWAQDDRALQRRAALVNHLNQAGITLAGEREVALPASLHYGRTAMQTLLDEKVQADVVVCSSDTLAQGAIMAIQASGLSVPADMAVMGFGDLDFAASNYPSITTVRIDRVEMGRIAARALTERLAGESPSPAIRDMGFTVIERESA